MNILTRVKRVCKRSLIQFSFNQFGTCKRGYSVAESEKEK